MTNSKQEIIAHIREVADNVNEATGKLVKREEGTESPAKKAKKSDPKVKISKKLDKPAPAIPDDIDSDDIRRNKDPQEDPDEEYVDPWDGLDNDIYPFDLMPITEEEENITNELINEITKRAKQLEEDNGVKPTFEDYVYDVIENGEVKLTTMLHYIPTLGSIWSSAGLGKSNWREIEKKFKTDIAQLNRQQNTTEVELTAEEQKINVNNMSCPIQLKEVTEIVDNKITNLITLLSEDNYKDIDLLISEVNDDMFYGIEVIAIKKEGKKNEIYYKEEGRNAVIQKKIVLDNIQENRDLRKNQREERDKEKNQENISESEELSELNEENKESTYDEYSYDNVLNNKIELKKKLDIYISLLKNKKSTKENSKQLQEFISLSSKLENDIDKLKNAKPEDKPDDDKPDEPPAPAIPDDIDPDEIRYNKDPNEDPDEEYVDPLYELDNDDDVIDPFDLMPVTEEEENVTNSLIDETIKRAKQLEKDNGVKPTFEDYINDLIENGDVKLETLKHYIQVLGTIWNQAGLGKANVKEIIDNIEKTIADLTRKYNIPEVELTAEEKEQQRKSEIEATNKKTTKETIYSDPETGINVVIPAEDDKSNGTRHKVRFSAIQHENVLEEKDGKMIHTTKRANIPRLNENSSVKWKNLVHPDKNNIGDKLYPTALEGEELDNFPVILRDKYGRPIRTSTSGNFGEWLEKNIPKGMLFKHYKRGKEYQDEYKKQSGISLFPKWIEDNIPDGMSFKEFQKTPEYKAEFANQKPTITFSEWVKRNIPEGMSLDNFKKTQTYRDKVPMVYRDADGIPVGFIPEVDWFSVTTVANPLLDYGEKADLDNPSEIQKRHIEENKKKTSELREAIFSGAVEEVEITENRSHPPLQEIQKYDQEGNIIPTKLSLLPP